MFFGYEAVPCDFAFPKSILFTQIFFNFFQIFFVLDWILQLEQFTSANYQITKKFTRLVAHIIPIHSNPPYNLSCCYYTSFYMIFQCFLYNHYNVSIPSNSFASNPIIYETTATVKEIPAIVAKFLKNFSSFATDI